MRYLLGTMSYMAFEFDLFYVICCVLITIRGRRVRDCMVVVSSNPTRDKVYLIQHYVIR